MGSYNFSVSRLLPHPAGIVGGLHLSLLVKKVSIFRLQLASLTSS